LVLYNTQSKVVKVAAATPTTTKGSNDGEDKKCRCRDRSHPQRKDNSTDGRRELAKAELSERRKPLTVKLAGETHGTLENIVISSSEDLEYNLWCVLSENPARLRAVKYGTHFVVNTSKNSCNALGCSLSWREEHPTRQKMHTFLRALRSKTAEPHHGEDCSCLDYNGRRRQLLELQSLLTIYTTTIIAFSVLIHMGSSRLRQKQSML
jgi:hypothetical protein